MTSDQSRPPGTYALLVEVIYPTRIEVGALGTVQLDRGWYAYIGSAFGSGGLKRVERHRELARGDRDVRHWHIDYLLGHDATRLRDVVVWPERDVECLVAAHADGSRIDGFGASDCDCSSHLITSSSQDRLERSLGDAIRP